MRKATIAGGFLLLAVIVGSIARSLVVGDAPTCKDCGGQLVITGHRDDAHMTATFFRCKRCGLNTVDHVIKDTGDGRYFDRQ